MVHESGASDHERPVLSRDDVALRVVADVLAGYRDTAIRRLPGVLDGDVEDLHQFRVAIRRARSVLTVSADVLPEAAWGRANRALRSMARLTSPVRDLDVLLLDLPAMGAAVEDSESPRRHDALAVLMELTVAMRERPAVSLEWALRGSDGRELMDAWAAVSVFTPPGGDQPGPLATAPAGELVDAWIAGASKRARRRGRSALESDDLEHWHDLRKALKRQRYLLAAFSEFYDRSELKQVRRRLRQLQEHIGSLQDIRVQEHLIGELASAAELSGLSVAADLADLLLGHLEGRLLEVQSECTLAWEEFDTKKNRRLIRHLTSG